MRLCRELIRFFLVFLLFIVIILAFLCYVKISENIQKNKIEKSDYEIVYNRENFEEQREVIKELEPLMEEIRAVMKGEIQAESGTPLAVYSYNENSYKDVDRIEAYAELVRAELNGDEGRIFIEYDITYYDIDGDKNMGMGSVNTEVIIEKQADQWKVVKVLETP